MTWRLLVVGFVVAAAARAETASPPAPEPPSLDRVVVPARGRQTATLRIAAFGRYAVRVESKQGTAVQLVDRMAGPGTPAGRAGEADGRLDLLLDRGEYRLLMTGHRSGSGDAKLDVRAFTERHAPRAPLLVELKPVDEELGDFEQVSYWLDLTESRTVWLEAAGRSLADLRLWRDGSWLVAAEPEREVVQPVVGQPLLVCRLAVALEPGLYLLTAYGGAPRHWAVDDGRQPFHLRFGIPTLGAAGRRRMTVSAFGRDSFLVPGRTSFFRLELPEARPAVLEAGDLEPARPFAPPERRAEITKKSRPPVAELLLDDTPRPDADRIVSVSGEAGQPYLLQHFELREHYEFGGSGAYWVATVHAGAAVDSIDATGILVRSRRLDETGPWEPFAEQTILLGLRSGWARRANLLATATLFVHVKQSGTYEVAVEGVRAAVRVEPFFVSPPSGYEAPPWQPSPSGWELDAGYYVVTLRPDQKGVARITMRPRGLLDRALDAVGLGSGQSLLPPRPSVTFPQLSLDGDRHYTLFLNRQPEVRAGAVVRARPLDLSDPLPIAQTLGDAVSVPFGAEEPGTLRAEAEDGQPLEMSLDDGPWDKQPAVVPGSHVVAVRLPGKETVVYSLRFEPQRLASTTPLPVLPDARLASLPRFDRLTAEKPQLLDLGAEASRTFLVRADRPGLYRVQSTGLLATAGTLRSRTVASLSSASQNGVGRNFSLGQYLREGEYQVTVGVQGRSQGHLGLELVETRAGDGGDLRSRIPARVTLAAGEAIAYRFTITKPGRFRVRSLGLERGFRCRLEDDQGWPLVAPGGAADLTRDFEPGRYRFTVLPETTPARVVTLIEPVVAAPLRRRGHGPYRLPLARRLEHVWLEPTAGERVPDRWELKLPAPAKVRVELTGGMEGRLASLEVADAKPIEVPVGRGFEGVLAAGAYRLEVVSARPNNRATYQLAVWPEPLLAGLERGVNVPAEVPVSIGPAGLYEIATFGASDVRGRLYDGEGRLVARSDDRPDDWNVQIAGTLATGSYRLRLEPVGAAAAFTTVSLRRREEKQEQPLALPGGIDLRPGATAHLYPLVLPGGAELVAAAVRADESVGVAIERREDGGWTTIVTGTGREASAECALTNGGDYRLRVWSLDRRDSPAHLTVAAPAPLRASERQAQAGLRPVAGPGLPGIVAAAIAIERPGSFRVEGGGVVWCTAPLAGCAEAPNGIVSAAGPLLWALGKPGVAVKAVRVALDGSGPIAVGLPSSGGATIDLAAGAGPALVRAVSQGGQPGLALGRPGALRRSGRFAVGTRAAVAVALDDPLAALVWDASPSPGEIAADVEALRFPRASLQDASERLDGELETGAVQALKLPHGLKRVRIALSAGAVAALSRDDEVESVHWAEAGPLAQTIETEADRLTLFPPREGPGRYSLEVFRLDADERTAAFAAGGSYETQPAQSGTLRIALAPTAEPSRLVVRGASAEPLVVSSEGEVRRGSDLDVPPSGGTLLLPHGAGLVVAMREPLASMANGGKPIEVKPPTSLVLRGTTQKLRVEARTPALLHLRASGPALTTVQRKGEPAVVELHREGVRLDAYVSGDADVTIRALAGGTLHGPAELTTTPVVPIGEGLGPEVLLGPGQARLFSFTVAHAGPVGLGVRAEADQVEAVLLSSTGRPLGRGAMQMPALEPGRYLLSLAAPADATPVRARPAVVGLVPPDTGPPAEELRQYVGANEEETGVSFSARPAEAAPPEVEAEPAEEGLGETTEEPAPEETEEPPSEETDASAEGGLS